jgi:organic hydroperoxide reductase OsmC/OhrA
VEGVLERIDGVSQFARYTTRAVLTVPNGADEALARKLLEKAEHGCLIANSLRGARALQVEIRPAGNTVN